MDQVKTVFSNTLLILMGLLQGALLYYIASLIGRKLRFGEALIALWRRVFHDTKVEK